MHLLLFFSYVLPPFCRLQNNTKCAGGSDIPTFIVQCILLLMRAYFTREKTERILYITIVLGIQLTISSGRIAPELVAGMNRNHRPLSTGICSRVRSPIGLGKMKITAIMDWLNGQTEIHR